MCAYANIWKDNQGIRSMQLNYTEKNLAKQIAYNVLVTSSDEYGTPTYYYVYVRGDEMQAFGEALKRGNFDPEEYGVVLNWGYGEPDEELKEKMKKYNGN